MGLSGAVISGACAVVGGLTLLALSVAVTVTCSPLVCAGTRKGKMTFAICFAAAKRLAVRRGDRDGATRFGGAADTGAILTNYHVFGISGAVLSGAITVAAALSFSRHRWR